MDRKSDTDLVRACQQGDREAYSLLVKRYSGGVLATCYRLVGNFCDAEDLTQETLLKGYLKIHRIRQHDRFWAWIQQIARNVCMDFFRRRKRGEILVADVPEQVEHASAINTDYLALREAIEILPARFRGPVVRYYFHGQSTENIAKALSISPVSVRIRLCRARKELRRLLELSASEISPSQAN